MLRRLLACLALLTGLAAAGTPAQAHMVEALASRMEASQAGHSAVRTRVQPATVLPTARPLIERGARPAPPALFSQPAPRVRTGIDRARE